ncbi:hypothetical protein RB195_024131 [Necator americanus]|uniref:MRG domain-containing protein n=1 Tax=Necator americanus TaxID=51031 RepID=A0ABR1ELY3_NECAM
MYNYGIDYVIVSKRNCLAGKKILKRGKQQFWNSGGRKEHSQCQSMLRQSKEKTTALRNPSRTTIEWRRGMEKIIYDFYSDLFDSHVHLPPHHLREDGHVIPEVLPSEVRHAIMSVKNRTSLDPDRIKPEHLNYLPPVIIRTLARLFTRYLSECKVPKQ